uniref:WD40 repeat domain-containing protein n=1 Tax=uncultured Nostoc sp. TaxID=340711 RepID=UPI0035CB5AE8
MGKFADKLAAQSPAFQRAYLGSLAPNSMKSGNLQKYYQTLADFNFLSAKINHPEFGVQALIEDYDLVDDLEVLENSKYNLEKVKALKFIQGTLQLSAHILATDERQLASQLWGRLSSQKMPEEIQALLAQAKQLTSFPWLCPLTPSLISPGGRLLRTLTGHTSGVSGVTVTSNGLQVISASIDSTLKIWNLITGEE